MNVLGSGLWSEDVVPTVAFNLRKGLDYTPSSGVETTLTLRILLSQPLVRRGNITLKIWDVAGQAKFRSMWARYCRGVGMSISSAPL